MRRRQKSILGLFGQVSQLSLSLIHIFAQAQWGMIVTGGAVGSIAASSMDAAYDSLRDTFDD